MILRLKYNLWQGFILVVGRKQVEECTLNGFRIRRNEKKS